jgi:hypothetical protein
MKTRKLSRNTTGCGGEPPLILLPALALWVCGLHPFAAGQSISFAPRVDYELAGSQPHSAALADFNADNHLDIAVAAHSST